VAARNANECSLRLKLSEEHSGFRMETGALRAMAMLKHFSGGRVTKVLGMALKPQEQTPSLMSMLHKVEENGCEKIIEKDQEQSESNGSGGKGEIENGSDSNITGNEIVFLSGFQRLLSDASREADLSFLNINKYGQPPTDEHGRIIHYKAFVFVLHETHGLLLLHCTQKKRNGPPHYQTPGGRVDDADFERKYKNRSWMTQWYMAARLACARNLQESTGLSMSPQRLQPVAISSRATIDEQQQRQRQQQQGQVENAAATSLMNEYKQRLFFVLILTNDDYNLVGKKN
jgi:hypothetical protein